MSLPVAVQIYSVRKDAEADLFSTLKKIKEMGYDGVEFAGLYGHSGDEVKKMLDEIGLKAASAHVPFNDLKKEETFKTYAKIGLKYIAIPSLPDENRYEGGNFEQTIADIKKIGKMAKEYGMQLLYHNHDFEFAKIGDEYVLDYMYANTTPDELMTELDTCWVNVGGENPSEYVKKYSGRAPIVHLKDFVGQKTDNMYELIGENKKVGNAVGFEFRPVGYGCQDWVSILDASVSAGAEWVIVEQDKATIGKTPLESIEMSRNYLKTLGF